MKISLLHFHRSFAFASLFLLLLVRPASGEVVASISTSSLANGSANQTLSVFLSSSTGAITDIEALSIYAEIGNGSAGQTGVPQFQSFTFDPAFISALDFAIPSLATPEPGNNFRGNADLVDFNLPSNLKSFTIGTSPTLIGAFSIDTTGSFDSVFDFRITSSAGASSTYISSAIGSPVPYSFSGVITVGNPVAVPEPSTLLFCGLGAVASVAYSFRRRRQHGDICVTAEST